METFASWEVERAFCEDKTTAKLEVKGVIMISEVGEKFILFTLV